MGLEGSPNVTIVDLSKRIQKKVTVGRVLVGATESGDLELVELRLYVPDYAGAEMREPVIVIATALHAPPLGDEGI